MINMKKLILLPFILLLVCHSDAFSQTTEIDRLVNLKLRLDKVVQSDSAYAQRLDLSISNMMVNDFLNNIAKAAGVNMNVSSDVNNPITCNFKQIRIIDILFFVCKEFGLDIDTTGRILSVYRYKEPFKEPVINLTYDSLEHKISFDFMDAKLVNVGRLFSSKTGVNMVIPQELFNFQVSAFGKNMNIENAIQSIAAVNKLSSNKKDETTWTVYREEEVGASPRRFRRLRADELIVDSLRQITARISNGNMQSIIPDVCEQLGLNYFFTERIDQTTGICVENVDFDTFLKVLFTGTNLTWRQENGIYIFGKAGGNGSLNAVKVVPMKYRTVEKVVDYIPAELKKNIEILTFPDQNSLILSGDQRNVLQTYNFIREIDKSVPLISIDVIILDATDNNTREAGITMGLSEKPVVTSGTFPGINMTLSSSSVNKLINSFNGFGSINLGKVTPNFYMSLKLLEENGKVIIRSTPRLSTLNGHKATLKSGEMKYYKESQTNIIGTQSPLTSNSYQWKNVEANLTLDITPFVSLDSCITLQVDLKQSEFMEREIKEAPPGTANRSFNSIIKVRNQEMVLLGGIERNLSSLTSKGLPFISRIPVLRWIFGSSSKKNEIRKLNIFIKPMLIE